MAGKRQHYVPRFLQRGFLAAPTDSNDESERTWLHRAGDMPRLVGIRDVGVEDWFYSRRGAPGEATLDDMITDLEQGLGKDVSILRDTPPGTALEPVQVARVVVHLVMRTAHLRTTITSGMTALTQEIEELFSDPGRLGGLLGFAGPSLSTMVMDAIRKSAEEWVPSGIPAEFTERLLAFFIREYGDELVTHGAATFAALIPGAFAGLADKVRDTHNTLVGQPLDEHGWVAALEKFSWSIEASSDLILPDAVALAREDKGDLKPLLFSAGADAAAVLMPIARDVILIGRRDPSTDVNLAAFNDEAARACQSFFIAARPFEQEGLIQQIGTGPAHAIAESIAEAVSEAVDARADTERGLPPSHPREFEQRDFSYRVTLHDFGDEILAREYGDILQAVIGPLSNDIPLHELDGITIAADYDDGLAKLDRGDGSLAPAASAALSYGSGVAKPVVVIRDGERKRHLVIAGGVAECWRSNDPETRAEGLHILITMLAGIANATKYPEVSFNPDTMARELHMSVARSPSDYWSAKQAAFIAPNQGDRFAELVIDSFKHAKVEIAAARERMSHDSDVQETVQVALQCLAAMLTHTADWLGHRAGLADGQVFEGSDLPDRLDADGLGRWIELFGRDLAACYNGDGSMDMSVVTNLSRHVERLLWNLGIYCWPQGDDVRCIVNEQRLVMPPIGNWLSL